MDGDRDREATGDVRRRAQGTGSRVGEEVRAPGRGEGGETGKRGQREGEGKADRHPPA